MPTRAVSQSGTAIEVSPHSAVRAEWGTALRTALSPALQSACKRATSAESDLAHSANASWKRWIATPHWGTTGPGKGVDRVAFVILGPTALYLDGRSVPLGAAKQRAMLAILLYYVGAAVRIDTLVEELWGYQRGPTDHRANLYALASRIRAVLAQAGISDGLLRLTGAYRLDLEPTTVDSHWFEQLVHDAREAAARRDPEAAIARLLEATGLWRGDPLADPARAHSQHLLRHLTQALAYPHNL